ncbi:MAG: RnfABCDGE type electron transport complex subunit B [Candidatus Cloacimonas sp.]|nr:RnfABCDGE type electron transport complex subunit B [Candidatus Cloacimonadota bacterium]
MNYIMIPSLMIGGLGLAYGLVLAFASKKFHVEVNPKIDEIIEILPNVNCGACGSAGCAGYAEAVVNGEVPINLCAPGGVNTVKKIAEILGIEATVKEKEIAFILCQSGGNDNTLKRYDYQGISTCKAAVLVSNGPNYCNFGCVFQNDCIAACKFDALKLDERGMRVVNPDKCTGCGACAKACPRGLIKILPISKRVHILCSSHDKGQEAKKRCGNNTACIGCTMCVKKCPVDAITMQDDLAVIDYKKCISCGQCALVCPTKAIYDQLAGQRKKAFILEDHCIGCTICARNCPVQAITGEVKKPHTVDPEICIGCGICIQKCPVKAIQWK